MSQDILSDTLNRIMNAKKSGKKELIIKKHSKLLRGVLDIIKQDDYLNYSLNGNEMKIEIKKINCIKSIKPRYTAPVANINYYVRRFLPAKNFGFLIISTNKGLMKHHEAEEKNLGGCLIAYVY